MIQEFSVKNFLSFKDKQTISFEATSSKAYDEYYCVEVKPGMRLLKLGIIFGPNASGKTNLLKAMNFLVSIMRTPKEDKTKGISVTPFLFDDESKNAPTEFELSFYIDGTRYIYELKLNKKEVLFERLTFYPSVQPALFFQRQKGSDTEKVQINFGTKVKINSMDRRILEGNTIGNTTVLASYSKSNIDSRDFEKVFDWIRTSFPPIVEPESDLFMYTSEKIEESKTCKSFIIELMHQADLNISDIYINDEEVEIDAEMKEKIEKFPLPEEQKNKILEEGKITFKDLQFTHIINQLSYNLERRYESRGTMRYYGLGGILDKLISESSVMIIDELDNSLHFELLMNFLKLFLLQSSRSQLIFSTHNLTIMKEDFIRNDSVWFTDKTDAGFTELYSASDFKFHKNISLYNAYRSGKLGAIPDPKNPFLHNSVTTEGCDGKE